MHCARVASRHGENDPDWRVVEMWEVGVNYYKLSNTCHDTTSRFICDLLGMRAVERSYPRQLTGRLFYRLCLHGLSCHNKESSGASRDYGVVRRARGQAKNNALCSQFG